MPDLQVSPFDVANMLTDGEVTAEFINQCYNPDDFNEYLSAFSASIRAVGIEKVSEQTEISHDQLLKLFGKNGNPSLEQTLKVVKALGLRVSVKVYSEAED